MSSLDEIELPLRVGFGSSGGPAFSTEVVGETRIGDYWRRRLTGIYCFA
jgi:hypothetical protein